MASMNPYPTNSVVERDNIEVNLASKPLDFISLNIKELSTAHAEGPLPLPCKMD